jgi:CBS domain-containing protein
MNLRKIDYMPVLEDDRIIGVVTRGSLMDLVKIRDEFGV